MSDSDQDTRLPEDVESSSAEAVEEASTTEAPSLEGADADVATSQAAPEATADVASTEEAAPEEVAVEEDAVEEALVEEASVEEAPVEEAAAEAAEEVRAEAAEEVAAEEASTTEDAVTEEAAPEETPGSEAESPAEPVSEDEAPAAAAASDAPVDNSPAVEAVAVEAVADDAVADEAATASTEATEKAAGEATGAQPKKKAKRKRKKKKPQKPAAPVEASEELIALRRARDEKIALQGRVFGWNDGGFHIAIGEIPAFCPRSEISPSQSIGDPATYIDQLLPFRVLKVQENGKRIVVSHAVIAREVQHERRKETMKTLEAGATVSGKVSSLTDFGAFVDLGGVEGLVHISEISRQRVENPSEVLELGQEVEVKILKIEKSGKRISLSIKALLPDPWRDIKERFEEGAIVIGRVERTGRPGAFIELEPGLTGLLPTSEMALPRDALPARVYPPGREVKVMIAQVDVRRRRIALVPEGAAVGGSRTDFMKYRKEQVAEDGEGFNAMAKALAKLKK